MVPCVEADFCDEPDPVLPENVLRVSADLEADLELYVADLPETPELWFGEASRPEIAEGRRLIFVPWPEEGLVADLLIVFSDPEEMRLLPPIADPLDDLSVTDVGLRLMLPAAVRPSALPGIPVVLRRLPDLTFCELLSRTDEDTDRLPGSFADPESRDLSIRSGWVLAK